ncbi:MAG: very short patch repair endonuclease [Proteobacteria bacterium]|nr:very short patch repair endonuclease [Pseudomonadota bacterium]
MGNTNRKKQRRRSTSTPPPASSEAARNRMKAARQRDTAAEMALRSALHRRGLRYRVDVSPLKGIRRRADVVFRPVKVAIFVDGCFWHGCPIHGTWPKANAEFWRKKIERNKKRDADTDRQLRGAGWKVIRVWEHEDPEEAAENISQIIRDRRANEN